MNRLFRGALSAMTLAALGAALPAHAQSGDTLSKISNSGKMTFAYRESSVPFSYLNGPDKPIGFAVDINSTADHNKIITDMAAWNVYASAMITAPTGDPEYFFTYATLEKSSANKGHYRSAKLEDLAKKMSTTFDTKEREQLAVKMQQTILDDNAYVFVSHLRMSMIYKANVTGLVAHPSDFYEITANLDIQ